MQRFLTYQTVGLVVQSKYIYLGSPAKKNVVRGCTDIHTLGLPRYISNILASGSDPQALGPFSSFSTIELHLG